jgi:hypothetical protein
MPEHKPNYILYAGYNIYTDDISAGYMYSDFKDVQYTQYEYIMKITISGETNEPISVELVKKP